MKHTIKTTQWKWLLPLLLCLLNQRVFSQSACASSVSITPTALCSLTDYPFNVSDTVQWFVFTADSQRVFINVEQPITPSNSPAAHLHTLELYGGSCSSLTLLASKDIDNGDAVFTQSSILKIDYAGLVIGQSYFIRVTRRTPTSCMQALCLTNVAYFSMCIQNVNTTGIPCVWPGSYDCGEQIGNGSFEYIDPSWNGGCPADITWPGDPIVACPWEALPLPAFVSSTPDFFNSCAIPGNVSVTSNGFGDQV